MHEDGLHVGDDLAPHFPRKRTAWLDVREEPARRLDEEHVLDDREHDRRENVVVVVARHEEYEEHHDVLGDGDAGPDVRDDVVAVVRAKDDPAVREEEVARGGVHEVDHVEDVQVYVRRHAAVHEAVKEREQREPAEEDDCADAAVYGAVELQVRAQQLPVVVGDGLVHRAHDGGAEAELGKHEDAEDRAKESVEAKIRRAEQPKEQRTVQERKQQPYAA